MGFLRPNIQTEKLAEMRRPGNGQDGRGFQIQNFKLQIRNLKFGV